MNIIRERCVADMYPDELDLKILSFLQEDGRASYREISKKLNISVGTVHNRLKKLKKKGVIKGFIPVIDPKKLGYELTALIMIKVSGKHYEEVEKAVSSLSNVLLAYMITGDYDISVLARFRDQNELNKFIRRLLSIEHVKSTTTSIVLSVLKEDFAGSFLTR